MGSAGFDVPDSAEFFQSNLAIKIIENNSEDYQLQLMDRSQNMIASWSDDNFRYNVYHDSIGSGRVNWTIDLEELNNIKNEFFKRKILSRKKARTISEVFKSKIDTKYWSGRPDIVIEVVEENNKELKKLIIGEVKYTTSEKTAEDGLKELLDYIFLAKKVDDDKYIYNNLQENNNIEITGLLLFDNINLEQGPNVRGLQLTKNIVWNIISSDQIKID